MGLRLAKVFNYNQNKNTVDCFMMGTGGVCYDVTIVAHSAGTNTGYFEFPDLKTINNTTRNVLQLNSNGDKGQTLPVNNLYAYENINTSNSNLEDPESSYVYAVIDKIDAHSGRSQPICVGFIFPQNNQVLFDPNKLPKNTTSVQQDAIKRMAGAYLHRTNSDVYEVVDANGNMEWCHPNGTFFRIAETPTQDDDGTIHVDFTGANAMAESLNSDGTYSGNNLNTRWDTSKKSGVDGIVNSTRKVYAHMEVVTEQGTIIFDVDKTTGSITITTPNNNSSTNNQININCGGNATIISENGNISVETKAGDIDIKSAQDLNVTVGGDAAINVNGDTEISVSGSTDLNSVGDMNIESNGSIFINSDNDLTVNSNNGTLNLNALGGEVSIDGSAGVIITSAAGVTLSSSAGVKMNTGSVLVGSGSSTDGLVLISKLITKFNSHQHFSTGGTGSLSSVPNITLSLSDGTS